GRAAGPGALDQHALEHVSGGLRGVRGFRRHPRSRVAGPDHGAGHQDRVQGPLHRLVVAPRGASVARGELALNVGSMSFREVVLADCEPRGPGAEPPEPICMVAGELCSGRVPRVGADELRALRAPPSPWGPDTLIVAYSASAEVGCFLALGWPPPANLL